MRRKSDFVALTIWLVSEARHVGHAWLLHLVIGEHEAILPASFLVNLVRCAGLRSLAETRRRAICGRISALAFAASPLYLLRMSPTQ